ncbi:MAG: hypothetical protein J0M07_11160 [Anaerolineae bacterium]|nr:hypothetical protein [Anaerolineae bacterium]
MAYPQTYVDLLDRFGRRGCVVCGLLHSAENHYIDSLLYEYSNDPGVHDKFRHGRGLCNHHSWMLTHHHGYALGVSILFEAVLDEVLDLLDSENATVPISRLETAVGGWLGGKGPTKLADKLEPETPCLACVSLCTSENQYVETLATYWNDTALQRAYQQSSGLCLPHFRDVLRRIADPKDRAYLVEVQRAKWEALKGELNQFQLKSAFNYVGEPLGAEADSWRRAVASMTGGEHTLLTLTRPR